MKNLFTLAFLVVTFASFSQNGYTPGYYVDQSNKKNEGFIEDTNPYNNPEKISFKASETDKATEVLIDNIKEFKINSNYKYVKYNVDYDYDQVFNKSEINIYGKDPKLKKKVVLLKVLVEGNATLYKAIIGDCIFFYFKTEKEETPKLLIHRKYNDQNSISENNDFRKQLYDAMKTESMPIAEFLNLNFKESELVNVFKKANNQNNSLVEQNINEDKFKNKIYYKVFAGLSMFRAPYTYNRYDMKPKDVVFTNPMLGFEISNIFGNNSGRSEIFGRVFYQNAKITSNYHASMNGGYDIDYTLESKISSINLTAGYRYAFYKKNKSKVFADGSLGISGVLSGDTSIEYLTTYTGPNPPAPVSAVGKFDDYPTALFFNLGIGYAFDNKYAVNLEYSPSKNYMSKYVDFSGGFSNFNLIFTYSLN